MILDIDDRIKNAWWKMFWIWTSIIFVFGLIMGWLIGV